MVVAHSEQIDYDHGLDFGCDHESVWFRRATLRPPRGRATLPRTLSASMNGMQTGAEEDRAAVDKEGQGQCQELPGEGTGAERAIRERSSRCSQRLLSSLEEAENISREDVLGGENK